MSISSHGFFEQLQSFGEGRILAETYFTDFSVVMQRTGVTEQEVKQRVIAVSKRSNKTGVGILVLMPAFQVPFPNMPGPTGKVVLSFVVLEHPEINRSTKGTQKPASEVAFRLAQLFHHITLGNGAVFAAEGDAIVPNDSFDGLVGYQVNLTSQAGVRQEPKVAEIAVTSDSPTAPATVTITCPTAGASVFYTTDGSYPSSYNTAALPYTVPFAQLTATTIYAAAEYPGMIQSGVKALTLAASPGSSGNPFSSGFSPGFGGGAPSSGGGFSPGFSPGFG